MAFADLMDSLEKAIEAAKEKEANLAIANAAAQVASDEYSQAAAYVETLRSELNTKLDGLFPQQNSRVRQSK